MRKGQKDGREGQLPFYLAYNSIRIFIKYTKIYWNKYSQVKC